MEAVRYYEEQGFSQSSSHALCRRHQDLSELHFPHLHKEKKNCFTELLEDSMSYSLYSGGD